MKLLLSSRSSSANGLLLFFSPRNRPWFQISACLTKIWKCLRFSGTSGTGTSCDLRFNKCVRSIRWGMSSQLDICFLDCVLIALSYCSGGKEENTSAARYEGEPGVGELLQKGKVINESDLHPFILTFLTTDWSWVQSFLVWYLFRGESSSPKTDIFYLLHSVTTRVFWHIARLSEFSNSSEFTRVSKEWLCTV